MRGSLVVLGFAMVWSCFPRGALGEILSLNLCGQSVKLEQAVTPSQWEKGLMYREALPKNHGMIFIFPSSRRVGFWMKNMRIPVSLGLFDTRGELVERFEMGLEFPTRIYRSSKPIRYAIEMPHRWFQFKESCRIQASELPNLYQVGMRGKEHDP